MPEKMIIYGTEAYEEMKSTISGRRCFGDLLVLTNGIFDFLHHGHVSYLRAAKDLGGILLVVVNDDFAIKPSRKILQTAEERAYVVSELSCVDYALIYPKKTMGPILEELDPTIHAKGVDYCLSNLPEDERSWKGKHVFIGCKKTVSSSLKKFTWKHKSLISKY